MHELGAARKWTPSWPSYVVKKAASVTFETDALLATCEKAEAIRNPRVQTEASAAFPMNKIAWQLVCRITRSEQEKGPRKGPL